MKYNTTVLSFVIFVLQLWIQWHFCTGKCLENAMCKVDLPFIVSFQRFLLDFFVDSYQVLSIHLREGERNYALNKRRYFPFSSLSASPTSIVRPWWLTSRSSSFLIHNQHLLFRKNDSRTGMDGSILAIWEREGMKNIGNGKRIKENQSQNFWKKYV